MGSISVWLQLLFPSRGSNLRYPLMDRSPNLTLLPDVTKQAWTTMERYCRCNTVKARNGTYEKMHQLHFSSFTEELIMCIDCRKQIAYHSTFNKKGISPASLLLIDGDNQQYLSVCPFREIERFEVSEMKNATPRICLLPGSTVICHCLHVCRKHNTVIIGVDCTVNQMCKLDLALLSC